MNELSRQFVWNDRRPIGAIHVADGFLGHRSDTNPGTYLFDATQDVTTPEGLARFAASFKEYTAKAVSLLEAIDAQGMICWDLDGGRYSDQMYLGSPDLIVALNPEMKGIVDDFFYSFRAAGLKIGVCLRPDEFNMETKKQEPSPDPYETLLRKAKYARSTWKCKLFYIDSNVRSAPPTSAPNAWQWGPLLPATLFYRLHKALPDCLFIPEHEDENHYLYTAPYLEAQGGELETPPEIRKVIPTAFSVININGHKPEDLPKLFNASERGDILLLNSWWEDPDVKALIDWNK